MVPKTHEIMVNGSISRFFSFSPSPNPWIFSQRMFLAWASLSNRIALPARISRPWRAAPIPPSSLFAGVFYTKLLELLFLRQFLSCHFLAQSPLFTFSLSLSPPYSPLCHPTPGFVSPTISSLTWMDSNTLFMHSFSKYLSRDWRHQICLLEETPWLQCENCLGGGWGKGPHGVFCWGPVQEPRQEVRVAWSGVLVVEMEWNNRFCNLFRGWASLIPTECDFPDIQ